MGLACASDLVAVQERLQVERALEEVRDLGEHLGDRNMSRSWVAKNYIQFVEISALEGDVVPILLECLFVHLLDTLDHLVGEDGKFDLQAVLFRDHWAALAGDEELRAHLAGCFDHTHDNDLRWLTLLVAYRRALDLVLRLDECRVHDLARDISDLTQRVLALERKHCAYKILDCLSLHSDFEVVIAVKHTLFD